MHVICLEFDRPKRRDYIEYGFDQKIHKLPILERVAFDVCAILTALSIGSGSNNTCHS